MSADGLVTTPGLDKKGTYLFPALIALCLALVFYLFSGCFAFLEHTWSIEEEYSHGYMIPLVALFVFWQKLPALLAIDWRPSRLAPVFLVFAVLGLVLGEITAYRQLVAYSFICALGSLALAIYGWRGLRLTWASFFYLIFMIPLPLFLYQRLSAELQLISTVVGVNVIRLFDISVYVSGNVIDLGNYQLQVVEACSGLRYLFPLMSFGFLIAYVYKGPIWHRWLIFLSTIPITVLMNSFRIGVIGVTVEYWGVEMAEGFLHDFEGWFVFMACLGVLVVEIWLLNVFSSNRKPIFDLIDLSYPSVSEIRAMMPNGKRSAAVLGVMTVILLAAIPIANSISGREEAIPERNPFAVFPLLHGQWIGRDSTLDDEVLGVLKLTDYIKADYRQGSHGMPVNFYVAYYQSQRRGSSIHSPRSCIPGGGWKISDFTQENMNHIPGVSGLTVNRMLIELGEQRQLVYYWFDQRGRVITSEYIAKWYLFEDALKMQRSDGSLVRLVTFVPADTDIADADARLQQFLQDFYPLFPQYLPN